MVYHQAGKAEAINGRDVCVPCNSPCLSFTNVLDISQEGSSDNNKWQFPSHLQAEVIRFFSPVDAGVRAYAKTLIFVDLEWGDVGSAIIHRPSPDLEPVNLIYRLDCTFQNSYDWGWDGRVFDFNDIGDISWSANLYVLLSGCDPVEGCVRDLCWAIMVTLVGKFSGVFDDPPGTNTVNYYLVDVPSWFNPWLTNVSKNDPRRLDQVLSKPDPVYSFMLQQARYKNGVAEDCEWEYDRRWPCEKVLERLFRQVHCISREQMKQRFGDKAYNLTFAPRDICAPTSRRTNTS